MGATRNTGSGTCRPGSVVGGGPVVLSVGRVARRSDPCVSEESRGVGVCDRIRRESPRRGGLDRRVGVRLRCASGRRRGLVSRGTESSGPTAGSTGTYRRKSTSSRTGPRPTRRDEGDPGGLERRAPRRRDPLSTRPLDLPRSSGRVRDRFPEECVRFGGEVCVGGETKGSSGCRTGPCLRTIRVKCLFL